MSLLFAELTATCNALGYAASDKYFVDKECKEAVRDLIRFLRRDDETHEIRRHLGSAKILQTDLVPILIDRHQDEELLDLLLRLLVNLTTPALLLYNEEVPTEKMSRQCYIEVLKCLQQYKQTFASPKLWTALCEKLTALLKMEWHERGEEKSLIIVRILILMRNVLHVPEDTDAEKRPDNDASTHDQILWALHEGGMVNLILYIASSETEHQYYFHVLEIVSLMLRDQNAEALAGASVQRNVAEKERDATALMALRQKELDDKQRKMKKHIAARHSRFGGTFVAQGVKSISDNDMIVYSLDRQVSQSLDSKKTKLKIAKNRRPMSSEVLERKSAFSVRLILKEFCIEFLNGAYNYLMRYIRELLVRGKAQSNDESYYFWTLKFFMEFNRHYKFEVKLISETMSVPIFHFIQERIEEFIAKLITDKKKIPLWSKRIHLGLKAYQELLNTLMKMYTSADKTVEKSAHTIISNIFYMAEYRELLMSLLNLFDEQKFSREYLKDLIESNHVFMKLLDHYCKRHRAIVVQKVPRIVKRKKKSKKPPAAMNPEASDEKWMEVESNLRTTLSDRSVTVDVVPFDAASEIPIDEQKVGAMKKIRFFLCSQKIDEAIAMFHASREVWPDNDCFGKENMSVHEEVESLKEIYFSDIGFPEDLVQPAPALTDEEESDDQSDNEEDSQAANVAVSEQSFQFDDFVKKFAKPKIVFACCLLLSQFDKNTMFTNHCILKLLHRIAFDCKYAAILFQASVFRTFQRILDSEDKNYKELQKFAIHIIRKFTEISNINRKVFMELLFWKGNKEAYEIVEGYGSASSDKKGKVAWTEDQEDELRRLFAEYERNKPDMDMIDWISQNLIDQSRSRKSLITKLKQLYLLVDTKHQQKSVRTKVPKEFSEAEIVQITQLYSELKNAYDIVGCMLERLDVKRSKKSLIDKMLELGLVQDRKELRKRKNRLISSNNDNNSSESEESEDELDGADEEKDAANLHTVYFSEHEISKAVFKVIKKGLGTALDWLLSSLEDVLEEIGEEESDVPLLPLSEDCVKAMDDQTFHYFLKTLGIKEPETSQEVYWRIPGNWQANDLRKRITLIVDCKDGNYENHVDNNQTDDPISDSERPDDDIVKSTNTDPIDVNVPAIESAGKPNNKRKRFDIHMFKNKAGVNSVKQKKRRIIRNDSSDEDVAPSQDADDKDARSQNGLSDSESETENAMNPRSKHKHALVSSDDESDSTNQQTPMNGLNEGDIEELNKDENREQINEERSSSLKKIKQKIHKIINDGSDEDFNPIDEEISKEGSAHINSDNDVQDTLGCDSNTSLSISKRVDISSDDKAFDASTPKAIIRRTVLNDSNSDD